MNLWLLVRTTLYAVLAVSSFLTWVLAAAFIGKTESEFDTCVARAFSPRRAQSVQLMAFTLARRPPLAITARPPVYSRVASWPSSLSRSSTSCSTVAARRPWSARSLSSSPWSSSCGPCSSVSVAVVPSPRRASLTFSHRDAGGAAGMADRLPGLSSTYCDSSVCSLGRSVEAFAWISWVMLTFLLVGLITFGALGHKRRGSGVWKEPFSVDAGTGHAAGTGATEKGVGHTAAAPPAAAPPTTAAPAPGANYNETRPAEVTAV